MVAIIDNNEGKQNSNGISFNAQDFPMNGPDLEQKQMIVFIWRVVVVVEVITVNNDCKQNSLPAM